MKTVSKTSPSSSFHAMSTKFLGAESTRDYVVEALLFALFVIVSAWPMISMLRANAELLK